jgi:hypothetical protein
MTDEARNRIIRACFRMMLPIARMLLANGIGYREFDEACRKAFVATASSEFGLRGRETNTSRISAMTGLPRKEVQRLRSQPESSTSQDSDLLSPLADLMHVWATSPDYINVDGSSKSLSLGSGAVPSFESLVRRCVGDVPAGAVKAELLRLGVVSMDSENGNTLRLIKRSLIPPEIDERLESAMLYSLHGLAKTIAHNNDPRTQEEGRLIERFVESHPIPVAEVAKLRQLIRIRLTEFSEELDTALNSVPNADADVKSQRIGVGLFYTE